MAEKRERPQYDARPQEESSETSQAAVGIPEIPVTVPPSEPVSPENGSGIDALMKRFDEQDRRAKEQDAVIRDLKREIAAAKGDISEDAKEAKRRYGYELDGVTRRADEPFEFGVKTLVHERKVKAVVSTETIGRPTVTNNYNKGTKTYVHDLKVTFHDGSSVEMDAIDFINQYVTAKFAVPDSDIREDKKTGIKTYAFRTAEFGTFEVSQKFVN